MNNLTNGTLRQQKCEDLRKIWASQIEHMSDDEIWNLDEFRNLLITEFDLFEESVEPKVLEEIVELLGFTDTMLEQDTKEMIWEAADYLADRLYHVTPKEINEQLYLCHGVQFHETCVRLVMHEHPEWDRKEFRI